MKLSHPSRDAGTPRQTRVQRQEEVCADPWSPQALLPWRPGGWGAAQGLKGWKEGSLFSTTSAAQQGLGQPREGLDTDFTLHSQATGLLFRVLMGNPPRARQGEAGRAVHLPLGGGVPCVRGAENPLGSQDGAEPAELLSLRQAGTEAQTSPAPPPWQPAGLFRIRLHC